MKKLIFMALSILVTFSVSAQFTGGGGVGTSQASSDKISGWNKDIMFIKAGFAFPSMDMTARGFKTGFDIEMPIMGCFTHNNQKVKPGLIFCIPEFSVFNGSPYNSVNDMLITTGLKLGPTITYFPMNDMFVNAYYAIHPVIAAGRIFGVPIAVDKDGYAAPRFAFMNTIGFNFKFSILIVGLEFDLGNLNYLPYETSTITDVMNMSTVKLTAGIRFQ
jgi:hypothetical protein